jgi:hypothetical protein
VAGWRWKAWPEGAVMDESLALEDRPDGRLASENLNRKCFCITLDRAALCQAVEQAVGDPDFCATFIKPRLHLFAGTAVFAAERHLEQMQRVVRGIEAAARLPGYRAAALSWAPETAQPDHGPLGAFMGYDFHLAADGPRLIEVNTNAGGAFVNALLVGAQRSCCSEVRNPSSGAAAVDFDSAVLRLFQAEWARQRRTGALRRIAIVDDRPAEQFLYPEFVLAQRLLTRQGVATVIADAAELRYEHGRLSFANQTIDLVYNRLVDFALDDPGHAALRAAYLDDAVVVTPNPHNHALFADKRNLVLLSDPARLRSWGLAPELLADLAAVPRTTLVTDATAPQLWEARRTLFFKPAGGHGGKAVYRGDKLTRGVWATILRGGYVAQDFAAPSERMIEVDGVRTSCKTDFRLYTYDGRVLLTAARLYQGQTTNFRTPGGGFAPVFVT